MVVAQVVRIRNNTIRTFHVQAGDPFYTPRIDGKPCVDGLIEVPPGFDQIADGLVVPWEAMTRNGLEIIEDESHQLVRCVIGPVELDAANKDWLQFRSSSWDAVASDKWMALGRRHVLGAVGSPVEMQLTFRDVRSHPTENPAELVEVTHFEHAVGCASKDTVFLNVFDLASALSIPNAMLCNTLFNTIGAFHAAVEVYGEEWSFYRTPNPTSCGVCKSLRPRHHPVHIYRQSINLGSTTLKDWEVRYLIRCKLAAQWPGGSYDLLHRNCIHFCDDLLLSLGVKPVPPWVRGLHETGASVLRTPWPLSMVLNAGDGTTSKPRALADADGGADDDRSQAETMSADASESTLRSTVGRLSQSNPDRLDASRATTDPTFLDTDGEDIEVISSRQMSFTLGRPSVEVPGSAGR
mmetsp:Transcript_139039/g.387827  ORF Transcript_139039/g.387827 Transcript_139039/m.387827 type:complete len:409 (+) Transcript_139039:103-1329(+)